MRGGLHDGCGCFPTGRHWPGIAHLLQTVIRGIAEEWAAEVDWNDITIALIDTETTGRDASVDRVVEVGVVIGRGGEILSRHNWLINPGCAIPAEAKAVHGIGDEDVKDAPPFASIAHEIAKVLDGCVPGAYNAAFDKGFLHNEFARAGVRQGVAGTVAPALRKEVDWVDPLVWAREIQKEERSKALGEVATRLGVSLENAHRAKDDAEAALRVFYLLSRDTRMPRAYGALVQEQKRLSLAQADERRRWKS